MEIGAGRPPDSESELCRELRAGNPPHPVGTENGLAIVEKTMDQQKRHQEGLQAYKERRMHDAMDIWMQIANDGEQDACYEIQSVRREDERTAVDLGDVTFIRQLKDPSDYGAGFTYNFEVGQTFAVPASAWIDVDENGNYRTHSNIRARIEVEGERLLR